MISVLNLTPIGVSLKLNDVWEVVLPPSGRVAWTVEDLPAPKLGQLIVARPDVARQAARGDVVCPPGYKVHFGGAQ